MASILALKKRFEKLDTDQIITDVFEGSEETFADLNAEQMFTGQGADDKEILPDYRPLTVEIKKLKGQPTDRVTLRDTGAFYSGIRVEVSGSRIEFNSDDAKTEGLQEKYGKEIFGLNTQYKGEIMRDKIRPGFKAEIESATGLKMKK